MKKMLLTMTLLVMSFVTISAQVVKIGMMGSAVGISNTVDDVKLFPLDGENYFAPSYELQRGTLYFRQDNSILWGATAFPSGVAVKNSDNRISIMEAGNYTINFNRTTGAYSVIKDGSTLPKADIVLTPSVPAQSDGCFVEAQEVLVSLSTTYSGGTIYYTTDGTDPIPNVGSTMIANSSVAVSAAQPRIKSVVYANDVRVSDIITKDFCFKKGVVTITTSPAPGSNGKYVVGQTVSVTMTSNVDGFPIYYSTDGTFPYYISESKKEYTTSFVVTENSNIMAHLYLGGGYRYGRYSELVTKPIEFQPGAVFPTFTYSTNPGPKDNGSYNAGTPVQVTFDLSPFNGNFAIFYSLDGNDVDLSKINTGANTTNPILYTGPFTVSENKVVYAKIYSLPTDEVQGVSPMVFNFEQNSTQRTIYVKREGSTTAPKIHVWKYEAGGDVSITNTSNWPNNLPTMTADTDSWFKYTVTANSFGTLFRYGGFQTQDFKYYSEDVWILLDANGNKKSVTNIKPIDVALTMTKSAEPKANGKYNLGTTVTATFTSNGGTYKRYIAYTTDGSDPKTSTTYSLIVINQYAPTTLEINSNTNLRAIEEGIYRSGPYSNEVAFNFQFEPISIVTITKDKQPNSNGKYAFGDTVNVSINRTEGCGGCSYADYYTVDGSDPKTSATKIAGSFVTLPITKTTTVRAISYPSMGSSANYTDVSETLTFETTAPVPTFTFSTNPSPKDNGKYTIGTPVQVTFTLSPVNADWDIYYSLDGNDVDLTKINTGANTLNPIRYASPFTVSSNVVVYAKLYNVKTGQSQGISPMNFVFEAAQTQRTIYVKREGSTTAPRIHVWTNDSGTDVAITNTSSWPNNLPFMTADTNGWFKYAVTANNVGTLFRYGSFQTPDYKYYNQDVWITLNADGSRKSVSFTKPFEETPIVLNMTKSVEPKANGKYSLGTTVTATFTSNGGTYKRYIAYTTDGSDPKTSSTYQLIVVNQYVPAELVINSNTNLRAIEEGIYRVGPYSNEVAFNFQFEPNVIATITKDIQPKANGKYNDGQTVNVTIGRTEGCGGCSYADYYTVDGTDPKTSATRIQGSAFVTLPITQTTTIRAFSYPAAGNSDHYTDVSETITFEPATPSYRVYVKRQSPTQQNPKFHVWTKESGIDVAITNTSNWPNNLPNMSYTGSGWYFYEVQNNQFGFLFRYSDKQTVDYKYYSKTVWVLLDANGNTVSITDNMPVASKEAVEVVEEAEKVFTVSPNPVSSNFTVNYSTGKEESINLNIYSLTGQLLYTESFQTTVLQKEFSAQNLRLSAGTYIVQAQSASGVETKKIVVE